MRKIIMLFLAVFVPLALSATKPFQVRFIEHEVNIRTTNPEVTLAGTLLIPENNRTGKVVLLITGSGDHQRDQIISGTPMFREIAEGLALKGIASLRLDDRGTAGSTGPNTRESTTADRVEDMISAMEWLRQGHKEKFSTFGVLGHSEGALIAIKMAASVTPPDFAVLMSAPALPGGEVWVAQMLAGHKEAGNTDTDELDKTERCLREAVRLSAGGAGPGEMIENTAQLLSVFGVNTETEEGKKIVHGFVSRLSEPWMRYFLGDNPTDDLRKLRIPVLAIYGSHDLQTAPGINAPVLMDGMLKAGNNDFTIRLIPGQDHFFLLAPGEPVGKHIFNKMKLSPELIDEINFWIIKRFNNHHDF
jgi:uncharacterized protein